MGVSLALFTHFLCASFCALLIAIFKTVALRSSIRVFFTDRKLQTCRYLCDVTFSSVNESFLLLKMTAQVFLNVVNCQNILAVVTLMFFENIGKYFTCHDKLNFLCLLRNCSNFNAIFLQPLSLLKHLISLFEKSLMQIVFALKVFKRSYRKCSLYDIKKQET